MTETENGITLVFIGARKNLRGAQRRVGNVCQTPRGFHFYDGQHWQLMEMPERIQTTAILAKQPKQLENLKHEP